MKNREYWSRNKVSRLRGILGVGLLILSIAGLFVWEAYGREALLYADVLVLKEDVKANTEITRQMFGIRKIDKISLIVDSVQSPDTLIGRRSAVFIPKGMPLYDGLFTDPAFSGEVGEKVFAIPKEWLYAYPDTLRRGDTIYFYEILAKEGSETYVSNEGQAGTAVITSGTEEALPVISARVAYVKDSGNREVIDVTENRLDASATVATIEVILDEGKYNSLKESFETGHQFILMYQQGGKEE